jgi:Protein of unknown function (DUF2867)
MNAVPVALPSAGAIVPYLPGAHFADCYRVEVAHPERTALQHFTQALQATPEWVRMLMRWRNRAARLVGLKTLDSWDPQPGSPEIGSRLGIFELIRMNDDEVIAGDADKHLRVVLSVQRLPATPHQRAAVSLTTVVHIHNWLGHLYMLPVGPAHKFIAPRVLGRVNVVPTNT